MCSVCTQEIQSDHQVHDEDLMREVITEDVVCEDVVSPLLTDEHNCGTELTSASNSNFCGKEN